MGLGRMLRQTKCHYCKQRIEQMLYILVYNPLRIGQCLQMYENERRLKELAKETNSLGQVR